MDPGCTPQSLFCFSESPPADKGRHASRRLSWLAGKSLGEFRQRKRRTARMPKPAFFHSPKAVPAPVSRGYGRECPHASPHCPLIRICNYCEVPPPGGTYFCVLPSPVPPPPAYLTDRNAGIEFPACFAPRGHCERGAAEKPAAPLVLPAQTEQALYAEHQGGQTAFSQVTHLRIGKFTPAKP